MAIATTSSASQGIATVPPPVAIAGGAAKSDDSAFSFHDLLSIVNPLQHFPIVSTIYRRLTGDTINPLERVVGDTLYGGWMGLASSVANLVFEKETGKDFGDTVLALVDGGDDARSATPQSGAAGNTASASVAAADTSRSQQADLSVNAAGATARRSSLTGGRIDPALGQRALYAYRRSMGMTAQPVAFPSAF